MLSLLHDQLICQQQTQQTAATWTAFKRHMITFAEQCDAFWYKSTCEFGAEPNVMSWVRVCITIMSQIFLRFFDAFQADL